MTWRAIQTKPAAEKRVTAALKDEGITAYLPLEHVWRYSRGRKTQHARPLLRGYVLAKLEDHELSVIHCIDGAGRYVGVDGRAASIPTAFVEDLQKAQEAGIYDHTRTKAKRFEKGQQVRITDGPFAGRVGSFARVKDARRVQIMLTVARTVLPVTADVEHLEAA